MRSLVVVTIALVAPGCDIVFDLSHDAAPDAPAFLVTGRLRHRFAVNDANRMPMLEEEFYASVTITAQLDDGSSSNVDYRPVDGTFAFATARDGQQYRLHVVTPAADYFQDDTASHLELVDRTLGRPQRTPVTMPTSITFQLGAATGFPYVASTGLWTNSYVPVANTANAVMDWSKAGSLSGALGLLESAKNDRLYWTELSAYPAGGPATHYAINASAELPVTQTDGGSTTLVGALTPRAHELCAHLVMQRNEEYLRLMSRLTGPFFNFGSDWWIYAVPSRAELFTLGNLVLAQTADGGVASLDVSPTFTNPFPGTQLLASSAVVFNREYKVGTAAPTYLGTIAREWVPLTASATCTSNLGVFQYGAAIPVGLTLAGQPLDFDDMAITVTDADPIATWGNVTGEPVDVVNVYVFELTTNPEATQTIVALRGSIVTRGTQAALPRSWFEAGKTYVLRVDNRVGYPGVADGDYATITYPQFLTLNYSRSFTLVPR